MPYGGKCRAAAWMPAKGIEIPTSVKCGSPREGWRSELSDLVKLRKAVVIVAGVPNAGSAPGVNQVTGRAKRHYAWRSAPG